MPWLQLTVAVDRDATDAVTTRLEALGAVAVTLSGEGEEVLLEPSPGEQPLWRQVRLQALLGPADDLGSVRHALAGLGARVVDAGFVADDDWQSRWRAHAVRACFGGRLWLLPRDEPFEAPPAPDGSAPAVVRLDPGLAFGSGSHPTTRLCLAALAVLPLRGARVLDFGCGSGILALAAALLGAREVVAVDHDPQALLATRDNASYNHIDPARLRVLAPEDLADREPAAEEGRAFDVVVANILANPLVSLAPMLSRRVVTGGHLVLSGVLDEQASVVCGAYPDIEFAAPEHEAEWICLRGVRRHSTGR